MTSLLALLGACAPGVVQFDADPGLDSLPATGDSADPDDTSGDDSSGDDTGCAADETPWNGDDDDCDGTTDVLPTAGAWRIVGTSAKEAVGGGGLLLPGDLDGDGSADLLVAAPENDAADVGAGAVALHDRATAGDGVSLGEGWALWTGSGSGGGAGAAVAALDADGVATLLVAEPGHDGVSTDAGRVWVVRGSVLAGTRALSDVASGSLSGGTVSGELGTAVAGGDLDGDGLPELVAGAPREDSKRGRVYVLDGEWWTGAFAAEDARGVLGGVSPNDELGAALLVAPDMDGDGYGELVACAPGYDGGAVGGGGCWRVPGDEALREDTVTERATAVYTGSAVGDGLGGGVHTLAAGDLDGDGTADLAIGAPGYDGAAVDGGAVGVWWSGGGGGTARLSAAPVLVRGEGALGTAVAVPGDLDGDGVADLLAGSPDTASGSVFAIARPVDGTHDAASVAGATWHGAATADRLGAALGGIGDLDGDGTPDWATAATSGDTDVSGAGVVYVLGVR